MHIRPLNNIVVIIAQHIPSFLVMTIIYIYVALASYNTGYLTLPMSSIENIVDDAVHVAVLDGKGRIQRKGGQVGTVIGRIVPRI